MCSAMPATLAVPLACKSPSWDASTLRPTHTALRTRTRAYQAIQGLRVIRRLPSGSLPATRIIAGSASSSPKQPRLRQSWLVNRTKWSWGVRHSGCQRHSPIACRACASPAGRRSECCPLELVSMFTAGGPPRGHCALPPSSAAELVSRCWWQPAGGLLCLWSLLDSIQTTTHLIY